MTDLLAEQCKHVRDVVQASDKDWIICVDGYEGSGKSTLAIKIGTHFPGFTGEDIVFDVPDMLQWMRKAKPGSCVVFDEGGFGAFNRRAMSGENVDLVQTLMASRVKRFVVIICIPSIFNLDPYLREHRIRYWWHVQERGMAQGHRPMRSVYYDRPTFWRKDILHEYGPVTGEVWDRYFARKVAYVEERLAEVTGMAAVVEPEKLDAAHVQRVKDDPTLRHSNGYADRQAIMQALAVDESTARRLIRAADIELKAQRKEKWEARTDGRSVAAKKGGEAKRANSKKVKV